MRAFTVYFSDVKDLTTIKLSPELEAQHWVTKADILKDAIFDLQKIYEKTLLSQRLTK